MALACCLVFFFLLKRLTLAMRVRRPVTLREPRAGRRGPTTFSQTFRDAAQNTSPQRERETRGGMRGAFTLCPSSSSSPVSARVFSLFLSASRCLFFPFHTLHTLDTRRNGAPLTDREPRGPASIIPGQGVDRRPGTRKSRRYRASTVRLCARIVIGAKTNSEALPLNTAQEKKGVP